MKKTLIERVDVGAGGAATIEFTSIPQDGVGLLVLISARTTNTAGNYQNNIRVTFNNSSSGYSERILYGDGSSAGSGSSATSYLEFQYAVSAQATTANTFSNVSLLVSNYAGSTNKSVSVDSVTENNATNAFANITAGLWSNTSAITSLKLDGTANSGVFAQYSTASLYKITAGNDGTTTVS